jgi:hypothetical protein
MLADGLVDLMPLVNEGQSYAGQLRAISAGSTT